ncbi:hypothetical protein FA95DRAFT_1609521 [Auriscalpium vulgare]|uniref:Uncharacterized protein n=1 Tax=Auriscalpium vulgare TaxID=40419 RepID=A0ACB8RGN7_9AGAM|nr:hypothetical protein FA95DRAFT_1609521 [Auriscalpium vulgare]
MSVTRLTTGIGSVSFANLQSPPRFVRDVELRLNLLRSPVGRMPAEILEEIFMYWMILDPPCGRSHDVGWMKVMHVCRRWRTIAANYSLLWTTIAASSLPDIWATTMLSFSKNAPLTLSLHMDKHTRTLEKSLNENIMHAARVQSPRVQHLRLEYGKSFRPFALVMNLVNRCLSSPLLESLTITGREPAIFSTILKGALLPSLTSLRLHRCITVWDAQLLSTLEFLQIDMVPAHHLRAYESYKRNFATLLSMLGSMSKLRTLILHNFFPMSAHAIELPPGLAELHVGGEGVDVMRFLSQLIIPRITRTRIFIEGEEPSSISHLLAQFGGDARPPRSLLVDLHDDAYAYYSLMLWDERKDFNSARADTAYFMLSIRKARRLPRRPESFYYGSLCDGLCFDELTDVLFETSPDRVWAPIRWQETFQDAAQVRGLYVRGLEAAQSLIIALWKGGSLSGLYPDVILFPALERFGLCDVELEHGTSFMRDGSVICVFEALCSALRRRQAHGMNLRQLDVSAGYRRYASWMDEVMKEYWASFTTNFTAYIEREEKSRSRIS